MYNEPVVNKHLFKSGHTACAGCGQATGARLVIDAAGPNTIVTNATGCLEIFSAAYPESAWEVPWIHSLFENQAAVASGVEAALRHLGKLDTIRVIAQGGDGGTVDIGFQALSGMMERGQDILYVCYDNEAYMNCLSISSLIMTKDGLKKITEVKENDYIYALDQKLHQPVLKKCTGVFNNGIKNVFKLSTLHHSIKATSNHPFLITTRDIEDETSKITCQIKTKIFVWKTLEQIEIGDEVVTLEQLKEGFKFEEVINIQHIGKEPTLDLRVEDEHNFIAEGIVVHNTGVQRSGSTPLFANTTTTPPGKRSFGNPTLKKNMVEIAVAHNIPYAATASVAYPMDVTKKVKKALSIRGPKYLHMFVPCPLGWRHEPILTYRVAKLVVETGLFPLIEYENGKLASVKKISEIKPVTEYLKLHGRFKHLFNTEDGKKEIQKIQEIANKNIEKYGLKATAKEKQE